MGAWLQQQTKAKAISIEVFSSTLLCGSAFVLLGGHALLIAGVSAPAVIFIVSVLDVGDRLLIDFLPWMDWMGRHLGFIGIGDIGSFWGLQLYSNSNNFLHMGGYLDFCRHVFHLECCGRDC